MRKIQRDKFEGLEEHKTSGDREMFGVTTVMG